MRALAHPFVSLFLVGLCFFASPVLAGDVYVPPELEDSGVETEDPAERLPEAGELVLYTSSTDPMLVGFARGSGFQVIRYDAAGGATTLLNRAYDEDIQVTAIAMGGDSLFAVGTNSGRIDVYYRQQDQWEFSTNYLYENMNPVPAITAVAFGGVDYLAFATDQGDFEVHQRPSGWNGTDPWAPTLNREYTDSTGIDALAVNASGWLLHGNRNGYVALWKPSPEGYVEASHWQIDDGLGYIWSVALEGDYLAFATDFGDFWRYERQPDDTYTNTLSRRFNSLAPVNVLDLAPDGSLAVGNEEGVALVFGPELLPEKDLLEQAVSGGTGPILCGAFYDAGNKLFWRSEKYFAEWLRREGVWKTAWDWAAGG